MVAMEIRRRTEKRGKREDINLKIALGRTFHVGRSCRKPLNPKSLLCDLSNVGNAHHECLRRPNFRLLGLLRLLLLRPCLLVWRVTDRQDSYDVITLAILAWEVRPACHVCSLGDLPAAADAAVTDDGISDAAAAAAAGLWTDVPAVPVSGVRDAPEI